MSEPILPIGEALRALPAPAPLPGGWQRLHATLVADQRRRWRRRGLLASAAMLGLLALLPSLQHPARLAPPSTPAVPAATDVADLMSLQQESARLEALLYAQGGEPDQAGELAMALQITDRLAWIDATLGQPMGRDAIASLWGERVLLLRELSRLRGRESWQLAQSLDVDATPLLSL